jgi:hypothetical protein
MKQIYGNAVSALALTLALAVAHAQQDNQRQQGNQNRSGAQQGQQQQGQQQAQRQGGRPSTPNADDGPAMLVLAGARGVVQHLCQRLLGPVL